MTEDDGYKHYSIIYWSNPDMGKLFYQLHLEYLKTRLSISSNHPYYFVSLSHQNKGEPYTRNALQDKFNQDIKKLGLNREIGGVNLHGFRHYYGYYCANILGLSKETTQRMLHHRSGESTEVYYKKTMNTLQTELEKGYKRLETNG